MLLARSGGVEFLFCQPFMDFDECAEGSKQHNCAVFSENMCISAYRAHI